MKHSAFRFMGLALVAAVGFGALSASAYDLPSVNLGFTSFLDGGPPAGPGWYYGQYVQYWHADEFADFPGGGAEPKLDAWIALFQVIYQADEKVLEYGKPGLDIIIPWVSLDLDPDGIPISDNGTGFGDLLIGPYLQWDPLMGANGPKFMHRIELQFLIPTGEYDRDVALNAGSNVFSFNPYWAATWFIQPRWTASWRLHYLWNGKNDDPAPRGPLDPDTSQAGQAFHANFATGYQIIPQRFLLGFNGYYLDQISNSEVNSVEVEDAQEKVLGLGVGGLYSFSQNSHLFLNYYYETAVENRPEGQRVNLRYVQHF